MRDENFLFSCLDACDRSYSFDFSKNSLYFLMAFGLTPCLIFLLMSLIWALSFFCPYVTSFDDAKSSWSLPSIGSSLWLHAVEVETEEVVQSSVSRPAAKKGKTHGNRFPKKQTQLMYPVGSACARWIQSAHLALRT